MSEEVNESSVLWFRHGLRFHDNPALHAAIQTKQNFYPIFIFDGESAGTKVIGPNRMRFLLESLKDLDSQLQQIGQRLFVFKGSPVQIFKWMARCLNMKTLCFEQDCEPIWAARDNAVKELCYQEGVECIEKVSHTLWDPKEVLEANGGMPPLTYQMFLYTVSTIGNPPRPEPDVDWSEVKFGKILLGDISSDIFLFDRVPSLEEMGMRGFEGGERMVRWMGGESVAIANLTKRISVEEEAFRKGFYLPNLANPDLVAPPTSQSAALRFGCLSVRRFYWTLHDLFNEVHKGELTSNQNITGQLIWREYFYTMSVNNIHYGEMARNPICLDIPWRPETDKNHDEYLRRWKEGNTGYPFIDAAMRQLLQEGWIHHVARNAVACFLTRGDLWVSWEAGLSHFLEHLLDADWSVCAGNWMWVSSSAFEQLLDCSHCVCPVNYGRRLDPWGVYIRRYVPELSNLPAQFIYEPWKLPLEEQEKLNCVIGRDYPERVVEHRAASDANRKKMEQIRDSLMTGVPHCCPSSVEEVRQFMWLPDNCNDHVCAPTN